MIGSHFFGGFPRRPGQPKLGPETGSVHGFPNNRDRKSTLGQVGGPVYSPLKDVPKDRQSDPSIPPRPAEAKRDFTLGKIGVRWLAPLLDGSGYAEAARNYVAALITAGVDVCAQSVTFEIARSDYGEAGRLAQAAIGRNVNYGVNVVHLTPENYPGQIQRTSYNIGFFAWETDILPPEWVIHCNQMNELWVPCQWTADVARRSGVEKPIFVFGHCATPDEYRSGPSIAFPELNPSWYKFYSMFQWSERKNPVGLLTSYLTAFTDRDPVVLILKTYKSDYSESEQKIVISEIERVKKAVGGKNQPRVLALLGMMTKDEIQALHRTANCFVLIHRAEGWGLPHFEACMMGKPVITTGYSGNLEFTKPEHSYLVGYKMTPVRGMEWIRWYTSNMTWTEPNIVQCRNFMRHVFTNRQEAEKKGRVAQAYVQNNFSWQAIGQKMRMRLQEIMRSL